MKSLIAAAVLAASVPASMSALAADVGVSIGINQPGVYGRIDIGRFPQPVLLAPQPVLVTPYYGGPRPEPQYLYVPPAHRQNWGRYCGRYNACGAPVYFVQDRWYQDHVRYERRDDRRDGRRDDRRDDRHDNRRDDHRNDRHDDHRGGPPGPRN